MNFSYDSAEFKKTFTGTWLSSGKFDLDGNLHMEYFEEIDIGFVGGYKSDDDIQIFDSKTGKVVESYNVKISGTISVERRKLIWKINDFKIDNYRSNRQISLKNQS